MPDRNSSTFSLEVEPYLDKLYRAAFRLTQNRADAEELVQDTCIRALETRTGWNGTRSPLSWLMRVQYNLFVDGVRRSSSRKVVPLGDADHAGLTAGERFDPEACADEAQWIARVQISWQQLKRDHKALLALRAEGYTLAEMKEITGLSVDVLSCRLQRARQSLARHLANDNGEGQAPRKMEIQR